MAILNVVASELELCAVNDGFLYRQIHRPYQLSLLRKHKRGEFNLDLCAKGYRYFVDEAAKKYHRDFCGSGFHWEWHQVFPKDVREAVCMSLALQAKQSLDLGEWE